TVSSTSFCFANRSSCGKSVAETAMFFAIWAVPAFPGAQKIRSTDDDCFSFQTNACSRPPPPITRIFIEPIQRPSAQSEKQATRFSVSEKRPERQSRAANYKSARPDGGSARFGRPRQRSCDEFSLL